MNCCILKKIIDYFYEMTTNQISFYECFYMEKIWEIMSSPKFIKDLKSIESFVIKNYDYLDDNWNEKNKIKIGVERLIRFYFYKNLNLVNIYPSPLSSDLAIELNDVVLCIDAKTIDMVGNPGDDRSIHFQKNQITFDNTPLYKRVFNGNSFHGIKFPPHLQPFYKQKPCLTYFITVNYHDDYSSFNLSHMSLCSVPHKNIVKDEYNNQIISNYKTYEYIGKTMADDLGKQFAPKSTKNPVWIPFSIKNNNTIDGYFDSFLDHPIYSGFKSVWKKIDNKFKICTYGGSARIDKNVLKNRNGANGSKWTGLKKLYF